MPVSASRRIDAPRETLFGRERERAALRDRLRDALVGRGGMAIVAGEAGIGKTTLVQALAREAEREGAAVLSCACYDLTVTPPYGPWRELFAAVRGGDTVPPVLVSGDEPDSQRAGSPDALFSEALDVLIETASRQPLMLVLDDLQWSDVASLEMLRYVSRQVADAPILIVATYRDTELDREHSLYQMLPALVREAPALRLNLRSLDADAVRALTRQRYRLLPSDEARVVDYLRERAQGNPFFIGELLRSLEDDGYIFPAAGGWAAGDLRQIPVPPLVQQIIERRLSRLDSRSRRLLAVASVIGQNVALDVWRAVSAASEEDLSAAIRQATELNLLEETPAPSTLRFSHALSRETLYYDVDLPERCALHRAAGEALASQPSPDPDVVSYHFREAGHEAAAEWLLAAGERAQQVYAWRTAAERFEAILPFLETGAEATAARGWLQYRIGMLLRYAAPARAVDWLRDAERVAADTADEHLAAYARADRGLICCLTGDVRRGLAELRAGVAALDGLPAVDTTPPSDDSGPRLSAGRIRHGALDLIGVSPDKNIRRGALTFWLAWAGHYADAIAVGERHVSGHPDHDARMQDSLGDALAGLGHAYAALGRPDEALGAFARARDTYQSIDHHFKVGNTAIYELSEALLPYCADRLMERRWLAEQAEAG